jgi:hypothetical protein
MPRCTCDCGAHYKFPETSLGKKSKCKKCGAILVLEDEDGILAVAAEPETEHVSAFAMQAQAAATTTAKARHLDEDDEPARMPAPGVLRRSYGADVLWTFLFPSTPGNLITFLLTAAAMGILAPLTAMMPLIGIFFSLIVAGWYAAFRLEILRSAASGEDDLPTLGISRDIWDDAIDPLLQWIGSWFVVLLPALTFLVFSLYQGSMDGGDAFTAILGGIGGVIEIAGDGTPILLALVIAGLCMWPIVVLCIAIGGISALIRADLIALTLVRTFPGYVVTVIFLFAAVALKDVISGRLTGAAGGTRATSAAQAIGSVFMIYALLTAVSVYVDIVVMRLVGLYYHHFKGKFAWQWE